MILESALVELVNDYLDTDIYLERYQKIELYVYDQDIIKSIIKACKFKDMGNVYDYPDILPQPSDISMLQLTSNYDMIERIAVSEKFSAAMCYDADVYFVKCMVLIDVDKMKKFAKKVRPILNEDAGVNMFRDVTFETEKGKFSEITNPSDDKTKMIDVIQHKVNKETLVFDPESVINEVMNDINVFFKESTRELYEKLEIPYKRGIILYGDPGNGKSAMIREIIRNIPDVVKVVINPGVQGITYVLASLVKALKGKKAIIIIEDMDSVITDKNRSEFLNVLDGVSVISGICFIGTTNYPERIDPAFMNRAGRFDRTYKIDNPSETMRRLFFESRKLGKILSYYKVFKDDRKEDSDKAIIDLFVENSKDMPMANLKEVITGACYLLASNNDMSVEEAVTSTYNNILSTRAEHTDAYNQQAQFNRPQDARYGGPIPLRRV